MAFHSTRHFIKEEIGGRTIWKANNRVVSGDNVAEVVDQYRGQGTLTIYSGVHGDQDGNFNYPERSFAYEDREDIPANVRVVNISRNSINVQTTIVNATTDVLFGWCFSSASVKGSSIYG